MRIESDRAKLGYSTQVESVEELVSKLKEGGIV